MCYVKPGPRCSSHARASFLSAISKLKEDPTEENKKKMNDAKETYYATPAGFKYLEREMVKAQYEGNKSQARQIAKTLRASKKRREKEIRAWKRAGSQEEKPVLNPLPEGMGYVTVSNPYPNQEQKQEQINKLRQEYAPNWKQEWQGDHVRTSTFLGIINPPQIKGAQVREALGLHTFRGADLRGLDLSGVHFDGEDFRGTKFDNSNCNESIIENCDLSGASFYRAEVKRSGFYGSNLNGTEFERATLKNSWVEKSSAHKANFNNSTMQESTFMKSQVDGASFQNAQMDGTRIQNTKARDCDFSNAKIKNGTVFGTTVVYSNFSGADLEGSTFRWGNKDNANFSNSNLKNVKFHATLIKEIRPPRSEGANIEGMVYAP